MPPDDDRPGFAERAQKRSGWPLQRVEFTDQRPAAGPTDATAAWNAVMELTRECYALAGVDLSPLPRHAWPTRLFRPGEPRPDSHGVF